MDVRRRDWGGAVGVVVSQEAAALEREVGWRATVRLRRRARRGATPTDRADARDLLVVALDERRHLSAQEDVRRRWQVAGLVGLVAAGALDVALRGTWRLAALLWASLAVGVVRAVRRRGAAAGLLETQEAALAALDLRLDEVPVAAFALHEPERGRSIVGSVVGVRLHRQRERRAGEALRV